MTKSDNHVIQKKAWRIMEQIASSSRDNKICGHVIDQSIELILEQMMITLGSLAPSARKPRLQLLETILDKINNIDFIKKVSHTQVTS